MSATLGYILCRVAISSFFGVCALLWAAAVWTSRSDSWERKDWSRLILELIVGLPMTVAVSGGFLALAIAVWRPMIPQWLDLFPQAFERILDWATGADQQLW